MKGLRWSVRQVKPASQIGAALASPVLPTLLITASAGVAFWWWTQWARGRAEADARIARAARTASGGAGPEPEVPPEDVMDHNLRPQGTPDLAPNPSERELVEPAPEIMAHTPPATVGVQVERDGTVEPAAPSPARRPKPKRPSKRA